jgi:hypothetical protein
MPLPEHLAGLERRIRTRFESAIDELRRQYETRLRRASDDMLASLGELRAPELEPFAGIDTAELAPRGAGRSETLTTLVAGARAIDRAAGQAEVLDAMLTAARSFVDRAGLLLVRADGLAGWGSTGFDGEPFAGRALAWDGDLLAGLAAGRGVTRLDPADARRFAERLGVAAAPTRAALVPLVLRDRIAAALYADDAGGAEPFPLGALQLLVQLAAARIELQPLTERTFSPTLYESGEAPGPGLALWAALPAAEPEPAPAAPPAPRWLEPAPALEEPPLAAPAVPPAAPAAPEPWVEPEPRAAFETFAAPPLRAEPAAYPSPESAPAPDEEAQIGARAEIDGLFLAPEAPTAEFPIEAPSAFAPEPVPVEPAPSSLEDSLWGRETTAVEAGFELEAGEVEPVPSVAEPAGAPTPWTEEPEPWPAPEPEAAPAAGPAAVPSLGDATVRIPVYRPSEAIVPPPSELAAQPSAPADLGAPFGLSSSTTQEVLRAEPAAPAWSAPAAPRDGADDATVLTRRIPAAAPAPRPEPEEETADRTAARPPRTTEVAPPPDVSGPGLAFSPGRAVRAPGENALHDEARRLARLLVSEIKLYNEEQVLEGRRNRDLYVRLREDIDRSRQIYDERVHESVRGAADYFHQELVRSLAGGDARALGM